jgi:hypothetical protein
MGLELNWISLAGFIIVVVFLCCLICAFVNWLQIKIQTMSYVVFRSWWRAQYDHLTWLTEELAKRAKFTNTDKDIKN